MSDHRALLFLAAMLGGLLIAFVLTASAALRSAP